ncbi:hypothetical protein ACLSU7_17450 [Bdellovibrio sp. HCB185ZH]|uniref:hypothetical protein n=1 Tax=Bdellovibrio sp. HCB185ZH TaxID=3394235 RepID=UPI0039A65F85
MKKFLGLCLLVLTLSSCASLKKTFCDCEPELDLPPECKPRVIIKKVPGEPAPVKPQVKTGGGIVVQQADLELGDKMARAMDAYLFSNEPAEFTQLCKDERFDCFVDDKRFPKDRKRIKRKVPAFLSGSKMGLQDEKRIHIKYNFYP